MKKNRYNIPQEVITESLRSIGLYMQEARKERGYTQEQLAEKMSCNEQYISRAENGKHGYSMTFFLSWCAHLQVNPYLIPKEISPARVEKLLGLEDPGKGN